MFFTRFSNLGQVVCRPPILLEASPPPPCSRDSLTTTISSLSPPHFSPLSTFSRPPPPAPPGQEHPLAESATCGAVDPLGGGSADRVHRLHHQPQLVPESFSVVVREVRRDHQVGRRSVAGLVRELVGRRGLFFLTNFLVGGVGSKMPSRRPFIFGASRPLLALPSCLTSERSC